MSSLEGSVSGVVATSVSVEDSVSAVVSSSVAVFSVSAVVLLLSPLELPPDVVVPPSPVDSLPVVVVPSGNTQCFGRAICLRTYCRRVVSVGDVSHGGV